MSAIQDEEALYQNLKNLSNTNTIHTHGNLLFFNESSILYIQYRIDIGKTKEKYHRLHFGINAWAIHRNATNYLCRFPVYIDSIQNSHKTSINYNLYKIDTVKINWKWKHRR